MKTFLLKRTLLAILILNLVFAASEGGAFATQGKKPITDDMITDQVRLKLAGDSVVKGGAIQVNTSQGVVTLAGAVETSKQKARAGTLAKKVKGVKQVVNNLTVKKPLKQAATWSS